MSATTLNKPSAREETRSRNQPTVWQVAIGAFGVVTVIAFVLYLFAAINFRSRPFIGAMLTHTLVVNAGQQTGNITWTGLEQGLRRNDQIIAIDGESLFPTADRQDFSAAKATYNDIVSAAGGGATIDVTVLRETANIPSCTEDPSGLFACTVSVTLLDNFPDVDFLAYFVSPYTAGVLLIILGLVIARYKFGKPEGLMAMAVAFGSALYTGGLFDIGTTAAAGPLWMIGACATSASTIVLGLNFPKRLKELRSMPYIEYGILGLFTLIAVYLVYNFFNPADAWSQVNTFTPMSTAIGAAGILIMWFLVSMQRSRARTPMVRDQANAMFIGTTLMLVPVIAWLLSRGVTVNDVPIIPFNLEALIILSIFPVAAITYAVLEYHTINTERVISEGITYSIMAGALILSMFLITLGASLVSIEIFNADNNAVLIAVILFSMVMLFTPLRNYLQQRIDKIYYREQRDLQTKVQEFNRRVTSMNDFDAIIKYMKGELKTALAPTNSYVFLRDRIDGDFVAYGANGESTTDVRFAASSPLVDVLLKAENNVITVSPHEKWPHVLRVDQPRLNLLKAQVLVGLPTANGELNGFVLLAPPSQKEVYSFEEISYLTDIVSQLAIATERSQVIGTLERRVQELDVLSQVGQAVNYTIELDDLLELIYNQTSRLLPVPNFYIVLYEADISRLYFAFFLENDDRIDENENVRWVIDNDLFSEVVKTNRPLRVSNFTNEMEKRGASLPLLESGLLSWMGVPLGAGRGILGVMAAGKRRDSADYTDEQFKIFSDVAALAATSLDKANLFNQTRIRQRQLSALNDISRQLVATETDVEKLLSIIMTSAVEILNAEAGSLLLNAEDDSGDLEFRVVIGGGGDDLLKTRIPYGQGVVGRVVLDEKPIIVNDTKTATIQNVDVTDDFVSRSLLAVPLTAKDEVIGVLEVINKTDGTPFVEEDADLLTTFASQAAVAIENARLFQQTDQQLSQRVKELETLERLDAQLNKTLVLEEVAEITVRQAMDILNANAGALGIVNTGTNNLEIVAIEGYKPEEYPEDAEGEDSLIWPLTSGVIGRVLRTRQADITMDVSQDPDYEHGLTNSNSQITLPMLTGDEINAILILEKNDQPRFSLPDWAFAQRIAEHASIALANAQFYDALNRANDSKSEFMGFAAHEMKTPLASVKGYAEVMLSGMTGDLTDQQKNFVTIIRSNAERMNTIIEDLRDTAKMENKSFTVDAEPMDIRHAVVETLRPFVSVLEKANQTLVNNVPEDLPLIWGDEGRIIQVLTNLMTNANKYSEAGTTITISAKLETDYVDKRGKRRGRMVVVSVQDEGFGISEEDQTKLFKERYFRSTNKKALDKPGTGLGMMLTRGIMEGHRGEIWIDSKLGEGSTFFISFPLAEDIQKEIELAEAGD